MNANRDAAALVGRVLLAVMFVLAGWGKITGFEGTAGYMASAGLPMTKVLLVLTIVVELGGGLALVLGWRARWAALVLAAFTLVATLVFHNFWAADPEAQVTQQLFFLKNLAGIGGLLMVWAFGPGRYSVDRS